MENPRCFLMKKQLWATDLRHGRQEPSSPPAAIDDTRLPKQCILWSQPWHLSNGQKT